MIQVKDITIYIYIYALGLKENIWPARIIGWVKIQVKIQHNDIMNKETRKFLHESRQE